MNEESLQGDAEMRLSRNIKSRAGVGVRASVRSLGISPAGRRRRMNGRMITALLQLVASRTASACLCLEQRHAPAPAPAKSCSRVHMHTYWYKYIDATKQLGSLAVYSSRSGVWREVTTTETWTYTIAAPNPPGSPLSDAAAPRPGPVGPVPCPWEEEEDTARRAMPAPKLPTN